jgi:hypothetical protein
MRRSAEKPQGPWHDFIALMEGEVHYESYMDYVGPDFTGDKISLDDDLFNYMYDTLKIIPSINPANPNEWPGCGLNHYGPTVINKDGANIARQVFDCWDKLFSLHPERIELNIGPMTLNYDTDDEEDVLQIVEYDRESLLAKLRGIVDYAKKAGTGEYYMLHLGV